MSKRISDSDMRQMLTAARVNVGSVLVGENIEAHPNTVRVATIHHLPHAPGYFGLSVASSEDWCETFLRRGIIEKEVPRALGVCGFDMEGSNWFLRTAAPEPKPDPPPPVEPHDRDSVVYFLEGVGGHVIKIGFSSSPLERLKQLQPGCPFRLRLLATMSGGQATEILLHRKFDHLRLHGEWFSATEEILSFISSKGTPWPTT
jgi:hypothetical protein